MSSSPPGSQPGKRQNVWQSPPLDVVEPILLALSWYDSWHACGDKRGEQHWTEDQRLAAMYRHSGVLARICMGLSSSVRAWRSPLREANWALVCRTNSARIDDEAVHSICTACPALTALDLSSTMISDAALYEIARSCPRLQRLSLQRNGSGGKHFSDAALSAVAAGCTELRSLHLGNLLLASNLLVSPWAVSLTSLNLTGSAWLSDSAVRRLAACASLQELWLSTCSGLRDGGLAAIASSCLRLRLVDVSNCRRVSDEGVCCVAALPLLSHLELAGCAGAADSPLLALARREAGRRLAYLGLSSRNGHSAISEEGLVSLAPACASLTHLNLASCSAAVTDRALSAVSAHAPRLRVLDLSRCDECTAEGLIEVCRRCPLLERLHLEGCDALTPAAGAAVASLSRLRYLGTHMAWLLRPNVLDPISGPGPTAEAVSAGQRVRAALPRCHIGNPCHY